MTAPSRLEIMSKNLSAGFYADEVLLLVHKRKQGIELHEAEKEFLEGLLNFLEWLSEYSEKDPFELAITAPLRYARL